MTRSPRRPTAPKVFFVLHEDHDYVLISRTGRTGTARPARGRARLLATGDYPHPAYLVGKSVDESTLAPLELSGGTQPVWKPQSSAANDFRILAAHDLDGDGDPEFVGDRQLVDRTADGRFERVEALEFHYHACRC